MLDQTISLEDMAVACSVGQAAAQRGLYQRLYPYVMSIALHYAGQREEAEEARKMDEARLWSESLRQEQAEHCVSSVQEQLASANTIQDLLSSVFGYLWMLHDLDVDRLQTLFKTTHNPSSVS